MDDLAGNLRAERARNRLKRTDVARRIGVSVNTVAEWENGKYIPNAVNLMKLSALYHMTPDELMGETARV
jgi:transcriptional regulator with XRE-family HTH domain